MELYVINPFAIRLAGGLAGGGGSNLAYISYEQVLEFLKSIFLKVVD